MPYRKVLEGDRSLYFIYAPPQTHLDPPNPDLPNPPYAGAPRELSSVYYYWWAFLRLNPEYMEYCDHFDQLPLAERAAVILNGGATALDKLYVDFRDVRGDEFVPWWKEHGAHCFAEPEQALEVGVLDNLPHHHDFGRRALLSIPLDADVDATIKMVRQQIRPLVDGYREQHGPYGQALYKVTSKPVLTSLDGILRAKKAKITNPQMTDSQLASLLSPRGTYTADKVNKQLRKADRLIANVINGRFPDFS